MKEDKGTVSYQVDGPIATITLSRAGKRNSMTQKMFAELDAIVRRARGEEDLRVLLIRGGEGTFCAGDDLAELSSMDPSKARDFIIRAQGTFTSLEALSCPVLAAVEGFALGGGLELALSCDLILAAQGAQLGLPELNLGIIPGLGGTIRLPRRTGLGRARDLIYSGRIVGAEEARDMGLADAVYRADEFEGKVLEYAGLLASKSPAALALAKSTLNRGMDASLEAGLALEREAFAYCFSLPDAKEGISAFLEKRKPVFGK
ncbi:MAG: enoyl-CoA hydratase/isomerase family protein [bacterium]|nr:enoyl-CoA hydratase/isomerase family protein [bacterium]